jgi:hypothetical protein
VRVVLFSYCCFTQTRSLSNTHTHYPGRSTQSYVPWLAVFSNPVTIVHVVLLLWLQWMLCVARVGVRTTHVHPRSMLGAVYRYVCISVSLSFVCVCVCLFAIACLVTIYTEKHSLTYPVSLSLSVTHKHTQTHVQLLYTHPDPPSSVAVPSGATRLHVDPAGPQGRCGCFACASILR